MMNFELATHAHTGIALHKLCVRFPHLEVAGCPPLMLPQHDDHYDFVT